MRRIRREESHENLVKSLTSGENAGFKEIWRLLVFSAALGVQSGTRRTLAKVDPGKAINDNYFSVPGWRGLLYLIGVTEDGDATSLKTDEASEEYLATLFEEYANQGLYILREEVENSAAPLDNIVTMILERASTPAEPPVIEDVI